MRHEDVAIYGCPRAEGSQAEMRECRVNQKDLNPYLSKWKSVWRRARYFKD